MEAKCIDNNGQENTVTVGQVYTIRPHTNQPSCFEVRVAGAWVGLKQHRFQVVETKRHNTHKDWKNYEFNIRSKDQIDDGAIRRDLSWTNPMMILETEHDNYVKVYLDGTIWDKAYSSGPSEQVDFHGIDIEEHHYAEQLEKYLWSGERHNWVHRRFLPGLIALVKRIKYAEWNKPCKTKCTVRKIRI